MKKSIDLARIVSRAQQGHRQSLESLVAYVGPRVTVYLYRMTLDYHLAQDLTQETMLTLIKSLQYLRTDSHASVWAWIYRTALGKGQHYFQKQGRRQHSRHTIVDHDALDQLAAQPTRDGLDQAQREELIEAMSASLEALKFTYRHVLVLRCFEQLSYAEIASVLGTGSELRMRLLFLRAKRALERQLHNRGFGRHYFLSGLTLFAMITSLRTKSAAAVPVATAKLVSAGAVATAIGALTTLWGIAVLTMTTLMLTMGAVFVHGPATHIPRVREMMPWGFPSRVIKAYDPNNNGWERLVPFDGKPDLREPLDTSTIGDEPSANLFLILPEEHWVEFGFPGPLVDGPGPDVEYLCLTVDKFPAILLTDGDKRMYRLRNATRERQGWAHRVTFDLAECKCPFAPMAIRVEGVGPPTQSGPVTLINLKARVVAGDSGPEAEGR